MEDIVYDLCIVGAGMFGSASARHASAYVSVKVCLIGPTEPKDEDRANREIFGAHYDEGRLTHVLEEDVTTSIMTKHAISRYRELEHLSGIQFYHPVGYLFIGKKDSLHLNKMKQAAEMTALPVVDLSYNDIFKTRFPYISIQNDDYPLLDDTGSGHISPRNMVAAQIKVAQNQGCQFIEDVVNEVKPLTEGMHEIVTEKGQIVKSKRVLFCTGAFTNFKNFPIPKLKIKPNKETVALIRVSDSEASRLSAMPTTTYSRADEKLGFYILPPIKYPNGRYYLKIGHLDFEIAEKEVDTLEKIKNWYLSKGDTIKIEQMSKFLTKILPGLKVEEISSATCVSCGSPAGQPYIDRISSTLTVAVVGKGKGAKFSDEIGRIAATLSLTGKWDSEQSRSLFRVIVDDQ